jgi:hypothetical protein
MVANSMEPSSREATRFFVAKEFPNILWNPVIDYPFDSSRTLVPILGLINSVCTTTSYILKTHIIFDICLCLSSGIFHSGFPTITLCSTLLTLMHGTCPVISATLAWLSVAKGMRYEAPHYVMFSSLL